MSDIPPEVWVCILERLPLVSLELCCQGLNKAFNNVFLLEWRVKALCWLLAAKGVDEVVRRLGGVEGDRKGKKKAKGHGKNKAKVLKPSGISADLGRLDQVRSFVERHRHTGVESVWEWMQLASQEPDAGWLCRGVSNAMMKGAGKCVMRQVVGKPQTFGLLLDKKRARGPPTGMQPAVAVSCIAWNHDGSLVASASDDQTITLWDPVTMTEKGTLRHRALDLAWNHDGSLLASAGARHDKAVMLWDPKTQENKGTLRGHTGAVRSVAWNHDGSLLASGSWDRTVRLWTRDGQEKGTLRGHMDLVNCVAWNHDGSLLASGSRDGTVRLWTPDGREKGILRGDTQMVYSLAWNHDGSLLASGSSDSAVRLWIPGGQEEATLKGHSPENPDCTCNFEDDGDMGTHRQFDEDCPVVDPRLKGTMRGHTSDNPECTCSRVVDEIGEEEYKANPECPVRGHDGWVKRVAWNHDGSLLASEDDSAVKLWDPTTMTEKGTTPRGHLASWQGLDPEAKKLAAKVKAGGPSRSDRTIQHIVAADEQMVYIYRTDSGGEEQGQPLACFCCEFCSTSTKYKKVETVSCWGTKVLVGCSDGQVSHLSVA